jgi:hypothetical protein
MLMDAESSDTPIHDANEEKKIERNQRMAQKSATKSGSGAIGADEESDDWEDVDCDDGDMEDVEEVNSEEEDSAEVVSKAESKNDSTSSGFVVVDSSQPS